MTVDPSQSAEIDLFDDEDLAAAAMSTVLLDEEALALEATLVRLGAMVSVWSEKRVQRGKEMSAGEREFWGERDK